MWSLSLFFRSGPLRLFFCRWACSAADPWWSCQASDRSSSSGCSGDPHHQILQPLCHRNPQRCSEAWRYRCCRPPAPWPFYRACWQPGSWRSIWQRRQQTCRLWKGLFPRRLLPRGLPIPHRCRRWSFFLWDLSRRLGLRWWTCWRGWGLVWCWPAIWQGWLRLWLSLWVQPSDPSFWWSRCAAWRWG